MDPKELPKHIGIIMDGNRRWAKARGLNAIDGHTAGAKNLEAIIEHCGKIGIKHLTIYALSTENWRKRSKEEVKGIFNLLLEIFKRWKKDYKTKGVKFFVLGNFQALPLRVRDAIKNTLKIVLDKERIKFNVALNYGGRDEIVMAIKNIIKDGVPASKVNEKLVSNYLYTKGQPDPDMIIRPGGEFRLSNFLLWQMSYAELYFTDVLWPDFGPKKLEKAIYWYQQRDRRKGK
ncbi:di-trans,poly-cis-decaprenylcistransferase [Patescibacteria group bacterium]|nr:di-trans,poly-cis-decaprenylcistransferase [Patescibacteria group bacterium]MBU4265482.1 di-trans,poly-cis-decaprenylcistransferase [Patescibacteria group bacterium]MBU4390532.1 di-trans,poly-cis-decaprenylcistransferase [Patescibacteria group bacterium]MBU4397657.1 di-trans,poly-cis-decaprenylcistransferase [Patescibacteria group bacterium]MBU4430691.1 di-trans,poly-cis-decaprenylcistransferase [Patescibacteria group bacterium]